MNCRMRLEVKKEASSAGYGQTGKAGASVVIQLPHNPGATFPGRLHEAITYCAAYQRVSISLSGISTKDRDQNSDILNTTPTTGGAFAAYASAIDRATGDPRTLLPR